MCDINTLEMDHIVEFKGDSTIFAAGRENGKGNIRIFLIQEHTGNVYFRNGRGEAWELVGERDRNSLIARVISARNYNRIPVYKVNGNIGAL